MRPGAGCKLRGGPARSRPGMMAHVRPRLGSVPLLVSLALASPVGVALAASDDTRAAAEGPGTNLEGPTRRERIEELWLDAKGESGWVRTVPLYLDDQAAEYRFGPAYCGKGHRLGEETLRALHAALGTAQPVRIDATPPSGDEGRRCITGVAFFAP